MLGSMENTIARERLYPAAGERVARMVYAFGGRVKRVVFGMRALEDYWGGAMAHALQMGADVPSEATMDRLVTQPRSWRKVVQDVACAAPDAEILVLPYERLGEQPARVRGSAGRGGGGSAFIEEGLAPENSYRVDKEQEKLTWAGDGHDGRPVVRHSEPDVTVWRRLLAWLLSLLPIERML